jgi:hypothetical protein
VFLITSHNNRENRLSKIYVTQCPPSWFDVPTNSFTIRVMCRVKNGFAQAMPLIA